MDSQVGRRFERRLATEQLPSARLWADIPGDLGLLFAFCLLLCMRGCLVYNCVCLDLCLLVCREWGLAPKLALRSAGLQSGRLSTGRLTVTQQNIGLTLCRRTSLPRTPFSLLFTSLHLCFVPLQDCIISFQVLHGMGSRSSPEVGCLEHGFAG